MLTTVILNLAFEGGMSGVVLGVVVVVPPPPPPGVHSEERILKKSMKLSSRKKSLPH